MKTEKNSFEPFMSILKIVYMCGVLLYFMFVTRNALGQTVSQAITLKPGLVVNSVNQQRNKVRQIYTSQIGVREKQPNSGPEVEKYLRYVNLPKGNPWCAAFVCWVFGEAGITNPKSGWSPALFGESRVIWGRGEQRTKSKEQGLPPIELEPGTRNQEPGLPPGVPYGFGYSRVRGGGKLAAPGMGDVFGIYFPEKGRIAHVGFVDEWEEPWVVTVEGNTNVLGSREGDGVYRKRRLTRSVYKVARYVE